MGAGVRGINGVWTCPTLFDHRVRLQTETTLSTTCVCIVLVPLLIIEGNDRGVRLPVGAGFTKGCYTEKHISWFLIPAVLTLVTFFISYIQSSKTE